MRKQLYKYVPLFLGILLIWGSCRKAEGPVMNYAIAAPDSLQLAVDQQTVHAGWDYPAGQPVTHFIVQLAGDRAFKNVLASDTLPADQKSIDFNNIDYVNEYYFRIKAQADNYARSTDYVTASLIFQNIFSPVEKSDLTSRSVVLKWESPADGSLTDILIIPEDSAARNPIKLTSSDLENKMIIVDKLQPLTRYTALIYDGKTRKGVVSFKTKDPNAVITINADPKEYNTLADAIAAAKSRDVINVGGSYDFSAQGNIKVDKSLVIRGVPDVAKPEIKLGMFVLSGNVGDFELYRLKLTGTSSYTVNVSDVTGTANVIIDSCDITGPTAGLIYASSDASSATYGFTVNNSLIHDFGADGGDFIDFRAGNLKTLQIHNSTFWNLARTFFRITGDVNFVGSDSGLMENCTVDNVCTKGFMDIRSLTTFLPVNKCILTNRKSDVDNIVFPHFAADSDNTFGKNHTKFIQYFFAGTTNITHLDPEYADAANGDFTVENTTLKAAGIGDPRWLK